MVCSLKNKTQKHIHDFQAVENTTSLVTQLSKQYFLPIFLSYIFVIDVASDVSVWWADALAANILKVL